jgi:hypothetical protein
VYPPADPAAPEEADDPVQRFLGELNQLRNSAGMPSYRQLAARAHYSRSALWRAARGSHLPSREIALALACACGGDRAEWDRKWCAARAQASMSRPAADDHGKAAPSAAPAASSAQPARRAGQRYFSPPRRSPSGQRRLPPSRGRLRRHQPPRSVQRPGSPGLPMVMIPMSATARPISNGSSSRTCTGQMTSYTAGLSFTTPTSAMPAGVTSSGRTPPDGGSPSSPGGFPTTASRPQAARKMPRLTRGGMCLPRPAGAAFGSRPISPWARCAAPRPSPAAGQTSSTRASGRRRLRRRHRHRGTQAVFARYQAACLRRGMFGYVWRSALDGSA